MNNSGYIKKITMSEFPLWEKARQKKTLLSVSIDLTARCNNNCAHCYINLPTDDARAIENEFTFEELKKWADEAALLGCLWFVLSGGEPLLRDDFFQIYTYLIKKGMKVTLFTNASLISDAHIHLFKKYPPEKIEVSVYGVTEKTHRKVTRENFFKATHDGIDKLIAASLPVVLKATILRSNHKELPEITKYCRNKSELPFRFDPFLHLRLDRDPKRNRQIISERLTPEEIIELEENDSIRLDALERKCLDVDKSQIAAKNTDTLFKCQFGLNRGYIAYDGTFKLCSTLCHGKCTYDLKKGTLTEAWKKFVPSIKAMTSIRKSFKETCGTCKLFTFCMWCPARADLEIGELDGHVPYFCDMAKKRYQKFRNID